MISRRDFLLASAAMLTTACTKTVPGSSLLSTGGKSALDALPAAVPNSTSAFSTKGAH